MFFTIAGRRYVASEEPIQAGDVVIDKRDRCWAQVDSIEGNSANLREGSVVEFGVPLINLQRLAPWIHKKY